MISEIIDEILNKISKALKEIAKKIQEAFKWLTNIFDNWKISQEIRPLSYRHNICRNLGNTYRQPFIKPQRVIRCRGNC